MNPLMGDVLEFTLNSRRVRVPDRSPNTTLLEYLRGVGLMASKEGCAEGDCGACSVAIIDRDSAGKAAYRSINSCLVPVCLMAGREIITAEGIACHSKVQPPKSKVPSRGHGTEVTAANEFKLHPVQQK